MYQSYDAASANKLDNRLQVNSPNNSQARVTFRGCLNTGSKDNMVPSNLSMFSDHRKNLTSAQASMPSVKRDNQKAFNMTASKFNKAQRNSEFGIIPSIDPKHALAAREAIKTSNQKTRGHFDNLFKSIKQADQSNEQMHDMLKDSPVLAPKLRKQNTISMVVGDSMRKATLDKRFTIRRDKKTKVRQSLCQQKTKIDLSLMLLTSVNKKAYNDSSKVANGSDGMQLFSSRQASRQPSRENFKTHSKTKPVLNRLQTNSQEFDVTTSLYSANDPQ